MSKMDDLRAMREARYEAARAGKPAGSRAPMAVPRATSTATPGAAERAVTLVDDVAEPEAALCGHRNMGGRTCTRDAGHAAKSHRYS
jgi:hypothetical protein